MSIPWHPTATGWHETPGLPLFLPAILSLLRSLTCVAQILVDINNKNLESDIGGKS